MSKKRKPVKYEEGPPNGEHSKIWDKLWELYGILVQLRAGAAIAVALLLAITVKVFVG